MTLARDLRSNPLESATRPLTDATLLSLLGGWTSATGRAVSVESALRTSAAYRGLQIISDGVGGMPFKVTRRSDRSEVSTSVFSRDRSYTSIERWSTTVAHMCGWGRACLWKLRNSSGVITGLLPIHPSRVTVDVVDADVIGEPWTMRFTIDGRMVATNYEVMYVPFLSLDGIQGLGPIGYVREAMSIALSAEEAAARLYGGGMMMAGYLTTDAVLKKEQAEALKSRWKEKTAGLVHAHDVAVLDSGAKFQQLSMNPADAQFLESRKFQVSDISRLLGIPSWMMNDQEKATSWGSGMESMFTSFVMLTLKPYAQRIEQRVNMEILPESQIGEFKFEGLLRGDSAARAAFYGSGIQHGWLVPNEPRRWENLPPVPWGDEPYLPFNKSAGSQAPASPAPTAQEDPDDDGD